MGDTVVMELADGRDLAWIQSGDPDGVPVFAFHGSPGRCHEFAVHDAIARDCGVRLVALDRPGYGHSTYQPRRTLADFPGDVVQLADHLGIKTFAVLGHSAGGPHALACARFLPHRVIGCAVASGVAPPGHPSGTEKMFLSNRIQWAIYTHWPRRLDVLASALWWLLSPVVAIALRLGRRNPEAGLDRFSRMLPPCDLEVTRRPEIRAQLVKEAASFTPHVARTSIQDMAAGIRDWGFGLVDIEVPVHIWHGDLDRTIPLVQGQAIAGQTPNATLHECPGEGHWLVVDHMEEILRTVTESRPADR
jgi:pimeloyl-ACP methyl ester carboxylesterase